VSEGSPPSERFDPPDDAAHDARRSGPDYGAEAPVEAVREVAYESAPDAPGDGFPWPPSGDTGVADAFVRTWQGATFQPSLFYRAMPGRGSLGAPLLYYLPLGILVAGAELFWKLLRAGSDGDSTLGTLGAGEAALSPIVWFLVSPLLLLLSLFLSAAVSHALLNVFGGAARDYGTTTRVFAFAYSPMIFSVVPVVGQVIGFIWMVVVAIIGLREAQRTSSGRAVAAVLIPVVFAVIMLAFAYLVRAAGTLLEMPL
jgi:hypothetical protein